MRRMPIVKPTIHPEAHIPGNIVSGREGRGGGEWGRGRKKERDRKKESEGERDRRSKMSVIKSTEWAWRIWEKQNICNQIHQIWWI